MTAPPRPRFWSSSGCWRSRSDRDSSIMLGYYSPQMLSFISVIEYSLMSRWTDGLIAESGEGLVLSFPGVDVTPYGFHLGGE